MDLGARVLEQRRKMPQPLGMPQPRLATAISKRPMVALAPKPVGCAIGHRSLVASLVLRASLHTERVHSRCTPCTRNSPRRESNSRSPSWQQRWEPAMQCNSSTSRTPRHSSGSRSGWSSAPRIRRSSPTARLPLPFPDGSVTVFDGDYASLTFGSSDPRLRQVVEPALQSMIISSPRVMRSPRCCDGAGGGERQDSNREQTAGVLEDRCSRADHGCPLRRAAAAQPPRLCEPGSLDSGTGRWRYGRNLQRGARSPARSLPVAREEQVGVLGSRAPGGSRNSWGFGRNSRASSEWPHTGPRT